MSPEKQKVISTLVIQLQHYLITSLMCLSRRYGIISLPPGSQHKKNNKKTWKIKIKNNKHCSSVFNKTCFNNNLLPKYTLFKIYIYLHTCI